MTMMFETVHICSDDVTIVLDCSVTSSLTMGVSMFKGLQKCIWRKHKPAMRLHLVWQVAYLNDRFRIVLLEDAPETEINRYRSYFTPAAFMILALKMKLYNFYPDSRYFLSYL